LAVELMSHWGLSAIDCLQKQERKGGG